MRHNNFQLVPNATISSSVGVMQQMLQTSFRPCYWGGMSGASVSEGILAAYDSLPSQMQAGARWLLDNPEDVALLSMRAQAQRAGVTPATMSRLAKRLGFDGFEDLRSVYGQALRQRSVGISGDSLRHKAETMISRRNKKGKDSLAADILSLSAEHIRHLTSPSQLQKIAAAARTISQARRVYVQGLRSSFAVAFYFHYVRSLLGDEAVLLENSGGTGLDPLRRIRARDVLVAVSMSPYTQLTVAGVDFARTRGARIVAITDSMASPICDRDDDVIIVPTTTQSFFHSMTPAFAVAECLAALVAAEKGDDALEALSESEAQLLAFHAFLPARQQGSRR